MTGIQRAATLEGLIMLSRLTISKNLRIPGRLGKIAGDSCRYYAAILDLKFRITGKNLMTDIDRIIIELDNNELTTPDNTGKLPKNRIAGIIILFITAALAWLPWFFI